MRNDEGLARRAFRWFVFAGWISAACIVTVWIAGQAGFVVLALGIAAGYVTWRLFGRRVLSTERKAPNPDRVVEKVETAEEELNLPDFACQGDLAEEVPSEEERDELVFACRSARLVFDNQLEDALFHARDIAADTPEGSKNILSNLMNEYLSFGVEERFVWGFLMAHFESEPRLVAAAMRLYLEGRREEFENEGVLEFANVEEELASLVDLHQQRDKAFMVVAALGFHAYGNPHGPYLRTLYRTL